jgi:hypothetical protein
VRSTAAKLDLGLDTKHSWTGWLVDVFVGAWPLSSKKQSTMVVSAMEAEYQSCGSVAQGGLSSLIKALGKLVFCLGFPVVIG